MVFKKTSSKKNQKLGTYNNLQWYIITDSASELDEDTALGFGLGSKTWIHVQKKRGHYQFS